MAPDPRAYCGYCGTKYYDKAWPRKCLTCKMTSYRNPYPVSVLMVPVWDCQFSADATPGTPRGILVGLRGHQPGLGEWGLPGGFVELSENFEKAAAREMKEETGIEPSAGFISPWFSENNSTGEQVLVFNKFNGTLPLHALESFIPCAECPEIKVCWKPEELAFKTHTEALARWFREQV